MLIRRFWALRRRVCVVDIYISMLFFWNESLHSVGVGGGRSILVVFLLLMALIKVGEFSTYLDEMEEEGVVDRMRTILMVVNN